MELAERVESGNYVKPMNSSPHLGAKDCSTGINTSEIVVDFQWHAPMDVSGIFQRNFTFQWHAPKDCHFPSGFPLELSNGFQWHFPMDFHFCDLWCVTFCPDHPFPSTSLSIYLSILYHLLLYVIYIYIYIYLYALIIPSLALVRLSAAACPVGRVTPGLHNKLICILVVLVYTCSR